MTIIFQNYFHPRTAVYVTGSKNLLFYSFLRIGVLFELPPIFYNYRNFYNYRKKKDELLN